MKRVIFLLAALAACGDNKKASVPDDAAAIDAAALDASVDAPPDAAPGHLTGCLDRPGTIPAAPNGALPCELVPPGLQL